MFIYHLYAIQNFNDSKHIVLASVVDPDFKQVSGSGFRIRIWIWESESGSGSIRAKVIHKNKKVKKLHVLKCWMFSVKG
jgi:hypothetical protein